MVLALLLQGLSYIRRIGVLCLGITGFILQMSYFSLFDLYHQLTDIYDYTPNRENTAIVTIRPNESNM